MRFDTPLPCSAQALRSSQGLDQTARLVRAGGVREAAVAVDVREVHLAALRQRAPGLCQHLPPPPYPACISSLRTPQRDSTPDEQDGWRAGGGAGQDS